MKTLAGGLTYVRTGSAVRLLPVVLVLPALLVYNWWVFVPLHPGLLRSPNELFSNLEVADQPFANSMHLADKASGPVLLIALALIGSTSIPAARLEWLGLALFACGGIAGGVYSQVCADEMSSTCRSAEWRLHLPMGHYLHIVAGILEFAAITWTLYLAQRRTAGTGSPFAKIYRILAIGIALAYPVLGIAYLSDHYGAYIEVVFFVGFTAIVLAQVGERTFPDPDLADISS